MTFGYGGTTLELMEKTPKKVGCGPVIIFGIILVLLIGAGSNAALGHYFSECGDADDILACMLDWSEEPVPEGAATATGNYTYQGHTVTFTLNIPLEGGAVTGSVSGTCDGSVQNASFTGDDNGAISGKITGTCDPFFVHVPATATFTGTVNKTSKSVPISFTGQGAGFSHDGSMSLSY